MANRRWCCGGGEGLRRCREGRLLPLLMPSLLWYREERDSCRVPASYPVFPPITGQGSAPSVEGSIMDTPRGTGS